MDLDTIVHAIEAVSAQIIPLEAEQLKGRDPKRTAAIVALKAERAKLFVALDEAKAAAAATE